MSLRGRSSWAKWKHFWRTGSKQRGPTLGNRCTPRREPSTVLRIPRGLFLKMLDGYPSAAVKLRDILATRSNQSTADIYAVRGILDGGDRR
jgi:hypothetical protein